MYERECAQADCGDAGGQRDGLGGSQLADLEEVLAQLQAPAYNLPGPAGDEGSADLAEAEHDFGCAKKLGSARIERLEVGAPWPGRDE